MSNFPAEVASGFESSTAVEPYTPSAVGGETFIPGDFVVYDSVNAWVERAGANPTAIIGISEVDSEQGKLLDPDGKVPIRTLAPNALLRLSSETTLTSAHVQQEYGITRNADGNWQLDTSKTAGNARCVVIRVDETTNSAYVRMLAEYLATDGIDS